MATNQNQNKNNNIRTLGIVRQNVMPCLAIWYIDSIIMVCSYCACSKLYKNHLLDMSAVGNSAKLQIFNFTCVKIKVGPTYSRHMCNNSSIRLSGI